MRALLIALLLCMCVPAVSAIDTSQYCVEPVEVEFLNLLNQYRATQGAGPVVMDQYLGTAAEHHTMLESQYNRLFHDDATIGFSWYQNIVDHGFTDTGWLAEITAGSRESAQDVMIAWQNSPPHNEGMIDPKYNTVGISRYDDGGLTQARYWWVVEFTSTPVKQPAILCGAPVATNTPVPPTNTATPVATSTLAPPTNTPVPVATNTPANTPTPKSCPTRNPKYPRC